MTEPVEPIIGIDLGTTKSVCSIWRDGAPHVIPNAEGESITPSVVAYDAAIHRWLAGQPARDYSLDHPEAAIYSIKRFMGRRYNDTSVNESIQRHHILYDVHEAGTRGGVEVQVAGVNLLPQEVAAKILQKIKKDAEAYLGRPVRQAVITVPAYFNDGQRQATRDAGRIAGLEVRRVLNEPTAACLAYGYSRLGEQKRPVAVYDLGGGTFDISILRIGKGPFRVLSTNGNTDLGGDKIDTEIVDWILSHYGSELREQLAKDLVALAHLRFAARQAKEKLSGCPSVQVVMQGQLQSAGEPYDLIVELTSEKLEQLAGKVILDTLDPPCRQALLDAKLGEEAIQEVLLVGGQTRMPAVRKAVRDFFGLDLNTSLNPEEVVGLGAGVLGGILSGQAPDYLLLNDVVPLSLGIGNYQGMMDVFIERNAPVPVKQTISYSTVDKNQELAKVEVYQGERRFAKDNEFLGSFDMSGIQPAAVGQPDIEITFLVDEDGILHVSATDRDTGNVGGIVVASSLSLSDEEVQAMVKRAELHAAEDTARAEQLIGLEQQATDLAGRLEVLLEQKKGSLSPEILEKARAALNASLATGLEARMDMLRAAWRAASGEGAPGA